MNGVVRHGSNPFRRFRLLAACIVLFALALRCFYIVDSKVDGPIIGDINQYVLYAWNLTHFATFSSAVPISDHPVVPDSYRGPGYPAVLAVMMRVTGEVHLGLKDVGGGRHALVTEPSTWITCMYFAQAVLGSLSVLLTMLIARFWLSDGMALLSGLITALWPHLVVFSAVMLSETVYGFALLGALWLLFVAQRRASAALAVLAGFAFGAAYLINPTIALFPLVGAILLVCRKQGRLAILFVLTFLIGPAGWAMRNATLAPDSGSATGRIEQNFVQGSWPQYFDALRSDISEEEAHRVLAAEGAEERLFRENPLEGFKLVAQRICADPIPYARWYLLQKPFLLWDWGVRNGWGDVYFLTTNRSPYERITSLIALKRIFMHLNPLFFAFAAIASLGVFASLALRRRLGFAISSVALLLLYVSALHTTLAAEPRYAIPYRFEEVLLAITALVWVVHRLKQQSGMDTSAPLIE